MLKSRVPLFEPPPRVFRSKLPGDQLLGARAYSSCSANCRSRLSSSRRCSRVSRSNSVRAMSIRSRAWTSHVLFDSLRFDFGLSDDSLSLPLGFGEQALAAMRLFLHIPTQSPTRGERPGKTPDSCISKVTLCTPCQRAVSASGREQAQFAALSKVEVPTSAVWESLFEPAKPQVGACPAIRLPPKEQARDGKTRQPLK